MTSEGLTNAYDYLIEDVIITADRWEAFAPAFASKGVSLKHVISEINLFESLDQPFLTANIVFLDNANIGDRFPFSGTERVEITLSSDHELISDKNKIIKRFIVNKVEETTKANDNNEIVILHLIEDRAFHSSLLSMNKVFKKMDLPDLPDELSNDDVHKNSAKDIIYSLLFELDRYKFDNSDYDLKNILMCNNKVQPIFDGDLKIIIPNMGPLDAIKWICDRCVTASGFPFFIFASIADDKIRFLDLESMLRNATLTSNTMPYTYSQALLSKANSLPPKIKTFLIKGYSQAGVESQNMYNQVGLGPATFNFIDTYEGKVHVRKHNPGETFSRAKQLGIIKQNDVLVYDDKAEVAGKNIGQYSATIITNVTTTRSQSDVGYGKYDFNRSYNEYINPEQHNLKIQAGVLKNYLHKSAITIEVPGKNFLSKGNNMSIGNRIDVQFLKNKIYSTGDNTQELDIKKSGEYLIYNARHSFSAGGDNSFTTTLELTKLSHQKR